MSEFSDPGVADFLSAFLRNAEQAPERPAVKFFRGGPGQGSGDGGAGEVLSFGDLDRAARSVAVALRDGREPGDRVLLSLPSGPGFVKAFLGCLYAALVPVPMPVLVGTRHQSARADGIVTDARPSLLLTEADALPQVSRRLHRDGLAHLGRLAVEEAETADPEGWRRPRTRTHDLAFLQYTSGSTSDPRGVMVSHGNLVHNIGLMRLAHGWDRDTGFCSWLPMHHDMGLIAMLLTPLFLGSSVALMSPTDFLKRPYLWPQLIHRSGAAVSCAPNFGYDLCARRTTDEQINGLDLSRWNSACNGAEPILSGTLRRFAHRFAAAGFRPEAFVPGYGLAEATLYVSGAKAGAAPTMTPVDAGALERGELVPAAPETEQRVTLVSSGLVSGGLDVRLVDPETAEVVPAGRVGEVWIRGESVTLGYWLRPDETRRTFGATTAGGDGGFLRTGDLAIRHDRELYITGRLKEMLVINGRNLYPHDIEREVEGLDEAFSGLPSCVFAIPSPRRGRDEELVIVQEVRARGRDEAELRALAERIKTGVGALLGLQVAHVVLLRTGRIAKTSSGKIQRLRMRELLVAGELEALNDTPASTARAAGGGEAEHAEQVRSPV